MTDALGFSTLRGNHLTISRILIMDLSGNMLDLNDVAKIKLAYFDIGNVQKFI